MSFWQGQLYNDDRLFILDLQRAKKNGQPVWAVTTRRNSKGFPPFRVDCFPALDEAKEFIARIEPTTPLISLGGKPPERPLSHAKYLLSLRAAGIPSALEIYELNRGRQRELLVEDFPDGGTP